MSSKVFTIDIQKKRIISIVSVHNFKGMHITEIVYCEFDDNEEDFFQAVKTSLTKIVSKVDNNFDRCIVGIPSNYFSFRNLNLPFKNRKKNSQILSFELEDYMPCKIDSVESDFCMLAQNANDSFEGNRAGVASILKKDLEQFKIIFAECGINPDIITTGNGYSSALAFAKTDDSTSFLYCFIHIEFNLASIYIIKFGEVAYIRTVLLNSESPILSVKSNLTHTLLSFNDLFSNSQELDEIILSGTAPFFNDLSVELENKFDLPVNKFNVFKVAKLTSEADFFNKDNSDLIQNGISMAVNETKNNESFNLTRQVSNFALFYQGNKTNIIAASFLLALFLISWMVNPVMRVNKLEKSIANIDIKTRQVFKSCFPDITTIVDPVNQMRVKVDALLEKKNIDRFNNYLLCVDLLDEISRALPVTLDIGFSRLVRNENKLIISGDADHFKTVDKMKTYFKSIIFFKTIDIHSATMNKKDNRVKFDLKISL